MITKLNNNREVLMGAGTDQEEEETAHREGDTLVIDSISIDEPTWIREGWFHSDQLDGIERLRRPSLNYLEYQFTIADPKVLTKPWTLGTRELGDSVARPRGSPPKTSARATRTLSS